MFSIKRIHFSIWSIVSYTLFRNYLLFNLSHIFTTRERGIDSFLLVVSFLITYLLKLIGSLN